MLAQWKPTKSNMLKKNNTAKQYYGTMNIPKLGSAATYDDFGTIETSNGTKYFKIEWTTPITPTGMGYGSAGKIAFWDENTNTEYHPWWNTSWNSTVGINVNSSVYLADYTLLINKTQGSCNANFSDLRCTKTDNSTLLPLWVNTTGNGWVTFYLKNNWTTANTTQAYCWCGNPLANNISNGSATFGLFEDFMDNDKTNSPVWEEKGTGTYSIANHTATADAAGNWDSLLQNQSSSGMSNPCNDMSCEWSIYWNPQDMARYTWYYTDSGAWNNFNGYQLYQGSGAAAMILNRVVNGTTSQLCTTSVHYTGWHIFNVRRNQTGSFNVVVDGVSKCFGADTQFNASSFNAVEVSFYKSSGDMGYFTNVTIRNFYSPEPTYSIGTEQAQSNPDTTSPNIIIQSPINTTYNSSSTWFNVTLSESGSWAGYSLDSSTNVSMINSSGNWNKLNSSMADGVHTVFFYANDSAGNMNSTSIIFTLYATEPNITSNYPSNGSHYNPMSKSGVTTQVVNITTDRTAECRYSTIGNSSFANMTSSFTYTNSTMHNLTQTVTDGQTYKYYIRCKDTANNTNSNDYYIYFDIAAAGTGSQTAPSGNSGGGSTLMETRLTVGTMPNTTTPFMPIKIYCDYESGQIGNDVLGANVNMTVNMRPSDKLLQPVYNTNRYEATFIPSQAFDYDFTCYASKEGYISATKSGSFKVVNEKDLPVIFAEKPFPVNSNFNSTVEKAKEYIEKIEKQIFDAEDYEIWAAVLLLFLMGWFYVRW